MTSSINFPCKVCGKNVNDNDQAIQCELCNYWIHINCNNLNYIDYKFLQNSNDPWYCILSLAVRFSPFNSMKSNENFSMCVSNFHNNDNSGQTNTEGSLSLKPSENLKLLVNPFNNNVSLEDNTDPENVVQSKYSMKSNKHFSMCVSNFHNNNNSGQTNSEWFLLLKPSENLKLLLNHDQAIQ